MKYYCLLSFLLLTFQFSFSQVEKMEYQKVSSKLKLFYNSEKYDSIFLLFALDMQKALPLESTITFFKDLKSKSGKIKTTQFVKYESSYAVYKTYFEHAVFALQISLDENIKINGLLVRPFIKKEILQFEKNSTPLVLPFNSEWTVTWGGDTKEVNYHIENKAQKNAFDFIITDSSGRSYKSDGLTNEDYYAFGKEIMAPCDGEIIMVVDGIKDNVPGEFNPYYIPGNTVIIKTINNEFLFFAHFKQHSIVVKESQKIKKGTLLGLCGNSGNSSEPHLHFHIQNTENINEATGVKCFFEYCIVNGTEILNYSPIKNDKVKNK